MSVNQVMVSAIGQHFCRESIDRFGDDLIELILSYLSFEDKIRLECLSKQCRSLIFNKQFVLEVHKMKRSHNTLNKLVSKKTKHKIPKINKTNLTSVLKKCPNLRELLINVFIEDKDLRIIADYCRRVTTLELKAICLHRYVFIDFGQQFGPNLKALKLETHKLLTNKNAELNVTKFLKMCKNLRKIEMPSNHKLFVCTDKDFLPKLEIIEEIRIYSNTNQNELKTLADKYSKSLKRIGIKIVSTVKAKQLKTYLRDISRFENLQSLDLKISENYGKIETIDESIALLAESLTHLKNFQLKIYNNFLISERFLKSLSELKTVKRLVLDLKPITKKLEGSVECLRKCSELTTLDIDYSELSENFFENIESILPKLRFLNVSNSHSNRRLFLNHYSDSIQLMPNLRRLVVNKEFPYYLGKQIV